MVGHDHVTAKVDALMFHCEGERVDNYLPQFRTEHWFLRS
jgi:hypothetical protein